MLNAREPLMNIMAQRAPIFPVTTLLASLPLELAVRIEIEEGVPILRASAAVQDRIELLLQKQQEGGISPDESAELDRYEDIDAYLSHLNRIVRNQSFAAALP